MEQCDFSDNFHDPSFGWGENGRRGGNFFDRVRLSTIRHCRANRVWDACILVDSSEKAPGFYRVGLTVTSGALSDLAWRDLYVVERLEEIGTEQPSSAARWGFIDPHSQVTFETDRAVKIVGDRSVYALVQPYGGERVSLKYPNTADLQIPLRGKSTLVFWIKSINENVPGWQNANPIVTLYESSSKFTRLEPRDDLLGSAPYNEARDGWTFIAVPLAGDKTWRQEGELIATVNFLTIGFDSWGTPPLKIWLDGLSIRVKHSGLDKSSVATGIVEQGLATVMFARQDLVLRKSHDLRREECRRPCNRATRGNPARIGESVTAIVVFKSEKSFGPGAAKRRESSSCSSRRMLTAKQRFFLEMIRDVRARFSTATSTSGGSSESEATALAVIPCTPAIPPVVTTVTPVAK